MTRSIICLVLMAGIALGVPVTWRFQATFNDGGALSGFFVFDADTNTVTGWDMAASAGSALAAFEYTPMNSQILGVSGVNELLFRSNQQFGAAGGTMQYRFLLLTFVSPLTNAGGTVLINVAATGGDTPHECLNCAPFRVFNQGSLVTTDALVSKVLPQFAFGGGWYSALYFTNTGATPVSFPVNFISDAGGPLVVPALGGSSTTVSLAPRGTAIIEAPNIGILNQGYVSVTLLGSVTGYAVFRQSVPGIADQEAVVPLSGTASTIGTLIWDDTNFTTAVAIVNPSPIPATVNITVRSGPGSVIGTSFVQLGAGSKAAVVLRSLPGLSAMAGNRGSADFTVGFGNVAVLGLRFSGAAFTSIPATDR